MTGEDVEGWGGENVKLVSGQIEDSLSRHEGA